MTEVCTKETRSFVRQAKTITWRKYTTEEKIQIVPEGIRREETVNELCHRGASPIPNTHGLKSSGGWKGETILR